MDGDFVMVLCWSQRKKPVQGRKQGIYCVTMRSAEEQKKLDLIRLKEGLSEYFHQLAKKLRQENPVYGLYDHSTASPIRDLELT